MNLNDRIIMEQKSSDNTA